ncbi:hypothetical protein D9758_013505 [Tetrapyrgos nigripes]|uniref:Uncharacterized protein n=1 Tax=Tetrapyrgos nigripes TaxID=182062 RepID=A0A8H5FWJ9_9AGAR|nr:hypothetical protein D9758_013505 [Tetrapyrgos nigripes]
MVVEEKSLHSHRTNCLRDLHFDHHLDMAPLKATVNCDMGEGFSLYSIADDEALMKTIHLANIACGFHASYVSLIYISPILTPNAYLNSDFSIMNQTVEYAKQNNVLVGAHPSLPDRQGFGRREMAMTPEELTSCFVYQVGALNGFLTMQGMPLHHIKPHGAVYGQMARSEELARAAIKVCKYFSTPNNSVAFVGLPGTQHEKVAKEEGVRFIPEWFADLDYNPEGKLLITKIHTPVTHEEVEKRVRTLLETRRVTTNNGTLLPLGDHVDEVTVCCHSDTPGAIGIAKLVKSLVDESNNAAGYVV